MPRSIAPYNLAASSFPQPLALWGLVLVMGLLFGSLHVQTLAQQAALPAPTARVEPSAAATPVQPPDRPEIKCSVVAWDISPRKPVLTLLCPAEEVFAPLRVHIKLSWERAEDVPAILVRSLVPLKTLVRVRTTGKAAFVRLPILEDLNSKPRQEWFSFTAALDIALVIDSPRR